MSWIIGVIYGGIKSIVLQYIITSFKSGRNNGIDFMNKLIK